jgi:hypothetical protein
MILHTTIIIIIIIIKDQIASYAKQCFGKLAHLGSGVLVCALFNHSHEHCDIILLSTTAWQKSQTYSTLPKCTISFLPAVPLCMGVHVLYNSATWETECTCT